MRIANACAETIYRNLAVAPSITHDERYDIALLVPALRKNTEMSFVIGRTGRAFLASRPLDRVRNLRNRMPDFLDPGGMGSSLVRVLLILGIAILLPLVFDKANPWHSGTIFAVAGILALRHIWWRAAETIGPAGWTWDCLARWSLLGSSALSITSSLSSFVILSRIRHRGHDATTGSDWWIAPPCRLPDRNLQRRPGHFRAHDHSGQVAEPSHEEGTCSE